MQWNKLEKYFFTSSSGPVGETVVSSFGHKVDYKEVFFFDQVAMEI